MSEQTHPEQSDSPGKSTVVKLVEAVIAGSEGTTLYGMDAQSGAWFAMEMLDLFTDLARDGWTFVPPPPPPCKRCGGTGTRSAGDAMVRCEDCRGEGAPIPEGSHS